MLVYVFIGMLLDRWLNTEPWFVIAGSLVGIVAFFVQLMKLVKRLDASTKHYKKEEARDNSTEPGDKS